MKHTKKLAGLLLALVLVFTMSFAAFAADETGSITIGDAVAGQTYRIYQILDLESYNADSGAYSYKAAADWSAFIGSTDIKGVYVNVNDEGYVTWVDGAGAAAFAKLAQKYAKEHSITPQDTKTADSTTVTFPDLDLGYYLVDSTLGTLCSLDTTNPDVVMEEKNEVPTNVKTVEEDSTGAYGDHNDADIGQTVNFKSTITAQAGAENYVFHDTMSAGLTYTGVTGVTLNGAAVDTGDYEVVTENLSDGCTFEVRFTQAFCDTLKANDSIVVSYAAVLNENAVVAGAGNPNESKLSYGDETNIKTTPISTTITYTWAVDVLKYEEKDGAEHPLAGAVFTLSKNADGSSPIAFVDDGGHTYRVAKTGEAGAVTEITTDATGRFTFKGLDSDTYYLTEITAPSGYNELAAPITVTIDENGVINATSDAPQGVTEVKVLNQTGAELPFTGGTGTTLFYVLGGVLVLTAVVLLVTRKRMRSSEP